MLIFKHTEYLTKTFCNLDISNKHLLEVEYDNCTFINCDMNKAAFEKCKFIDCQFEECNLSLVKFNLCKFYDTDFYNCKIIGIDWTTASWSNILAFSPICFRKSIINDSSFFGLDLKGFIAEECTIHNVDFREANISQGVFDYSDLNESIFNNTNLSSSSFSEATNYNININNNNVKGAKFTVGEATRLLTSLDIELLP